MKRKLMTALAFILVLSLATPALTARAAQPDGYWPYFTAYENALNSGSTDDILKTGDALLAFYAKYPMNEDIAGMSYNVYFDRYTRAVFEKRGNYAEAILNAERLAAVADYLGFKDAAVAARARAGKIDPMTGVYALSNAQTPGAYFGAKYEPNSGAYYGRVASFGASGSGASGLKNSADIAGEAIVSFYVELGQNAASDFSWMISPYDDGKHLIHIAFNFPEKASTAASIVRGTYDANISKTLRYLATLRCPVFLRIGGEMNLWEMDAALFRDAYQHVAALARDEAPNVALVWSPNSVGSWGSNVSDFYPGDAYVDWVGMSLYSDVEPKAGQAPYDDDSMYFGRGAFGDCVLSAREVCRFALSRNKPVIVTEGGTGLVSNTGKKYDAEASAELTKRYAVLNMVYPNIKAIVYFDSDFAGDVYKYALINSAAAGAAYAAAVKANPTLLSGTGVTRPSYVGLTDYSAPSGTVDIFAYSDTVYGGAMNVTYSLAGSSLGSLNAYPYRLTLDTSALAVGSYAFDAVFSDGAGYTATKTYTLTKLGNGNVIFADGYSALPDAPSDWAKEEVALAMGKSLVPDVLSTRYSPNITRYDFCKLAVKLVEQKTGKSIGNVMKDRGVSVNYNAFSDTSDIRVLEACALGIVGGRGGGIFDGTAGISREEAAKMLKNTADLLGIKSNKPAASFSDAASFSGWAVTAIEFVSSTADKSSGKVVMGGIGSNLFGPKGAYTYQQAFVTMLRLLRAG